MVDYNRIICIDAETDILNFGNGVKELTYGKEYIIEHSYLLRSDGRHYITIKNDQGNRNEYLSNRFVRADIYREITIDNILK